MKSNKHVVHPSTVITECKEEQNRLVGYNDKLLEYIADHVLGSILFFDLAIIIPLLAISAPDWVKAIVIILSSNWIQLWALFALQHTQKKADNARNIKADVDHEALTHIANTVEQLTQKDA